jgi:hypothetical protein
MDDEFIYNNIVPIDISNQEVNTNYNNLLTETNNNNKEFINLIKGVDTELEKNKHIAGIDKYSLETLISDTKWNIYYYKKYKRINEILRRVMVGLIIILILAKLRSDYFDDTSFHIIVGFLISILFIYVLYSLWDLYLRDEKNFDEYSFGEYNNEDVSGVRISGPSIQVKTDYDASYCNFISDMLTEKQQKDGISSHLNVGISADEMIERLRHYM